jgi:hypothetical protein
MILEAIFEPDFHVFSHGFRKGHRPHQALHELREQCRKLNINWRVDADVSGFFDNLDWCHLRKFMQQRVKDGGIGYIRFSWIYPLLGQDTPWILGHQAQDGWETPAPVYERDMDMVS